MRSARSPAESCKRFPRDFRFGFDASARLGDYRFHPAASFREGARL